MIFQFFTFGLKTKLEQKIQSSVNLTITDNTHSMVCIKTGKNGYNIRLHHMFLQADEKVINDIVRYAVCGRSRYIQKFIDEHSDCIGHSRKAGKMRIRHRGVVFNVKNIFHELNREYFNREVTSPITWGKRSSRKSRSCIQFGSFDGLSDVIRINTKLDSPCVPEFFIRYIIYHEMLHAWFGKTAGTRHTPAFRNKEKEYREYHRAIAWQNNNLHLFLEAAK